MRIIWQDHLGGGASKEEAPQKKEPSIEETMEETWPHTTAPAIEPSPRETVKGFGLGK
jgi:hypothetical protein